MHDPVEVGAGEMTDHDPLCPPVLRIQQRGCDVCDLIARVRADEREQAPCWVVYGHGHYPAALAKIAHAEAVAARLVEVVCEQDDLIQIVGVDATNHRAAAADMRRERDAARAEVERLNIEIGKVVNSRERTRVEMGQKVIDANREVALARAQRDAARAESAGRAREIDALHAEVAALRESLAGEIREAEVARKHARVLADLRAKVEQIVYGPPGRLKRMYRQGWQDGCEAVLVLIEEKEADHGK